MVSTHQKPVLRSITTVDENENTYNNINFKRRRIQSPEQEESSSSSAQSTSPFASSNTNTQQKLTSPTPAPVKVKHTDYSTSAIMDSEDEDEDEIKPFFNVKFNNANTNTKLNPSSFSDLDDDEVLGQSEEENIFNSDDDNEYYSAASDYETEVKPRYFTKSYKFKHTATTDDYLKVHLKLTGDMQLFNDHEDDENQSTFINNGDSKFELSQLEANFQKIIDENKQLYQIESSESSSEVSSPVDPTTPTSVDILPSSNSNIEDYLDILSNELEESNTTTTTSSSFKQPKFLQYRHDEKHNLAFPDVSTFPIGYNSTIAKKGNGKRIRALNRRAILSGKASEMVGTGLSEFEMTML